MRLFNSYLGYTLLFIIIASFLVLIRMKTSQFKKILKVFLSLVVGWILIMQVLVVSDFYSKIPEEKTVDYLIVLGAGLKGDRVSYTLGYRLDAAAVYLKKHETTQVIVSGGQGPDEWVSEAYAMQQYLLDRGIDSDRIILEDQSTSTEENIRFSRQLMGSNGHAAIVTSNYHMYRAKYIARPYLGQVDGISAHAPYWSLLNYMVRESITIPNEWRKKMLS